MSADLFAQFGPGSGSQPPSRQPNQQTQQQPQHQRHQQPQQSDDPFAFLSTALSQPLSPASTASPQPQITQPWPAYGNPVQPVSATANTWSSSAWSSTPITTTAATNNDNDDEDAWGDFEDASPSQMTAAAPAPAAPAVASPALAWPAPQPVSPALPTPSPAQPQVRTRVVRANTMDLLTNTLIGVGDNQLAQKKPANPNVLFDAEEDYDSDENGDGDDEFGDFETGQASPPRFAPAPAPVAVPAPTPAPAARPVARVAPPHHTGPALVDLLSLSDLDLGPPTPPTVSPPAGQQPPHQSLNFRPSSELSSLTPSATRKPQPPNLLSPLSFGSTATADTSAYPHPPKSPSFRDRNPFPGLAVTTPLSAEFPKDKVEERSPSPVTAWPTLETLTSSTAASKKPEPKNDLIDSWDAWDSIDSTSAQQNASKNKQNAPAAAAVATSSSDWDWDADTTADTTSRAELDRTASPALPPAITNIPAAKTLPDGTPPPTNVPPPAVLLSLFLELIALPDDALFKPIAAQSAEVRSRILSHAKTITFLRNYLELVVVAARVVAGRKQRWHRDKFLKQSMSISAAGSSRGGGMKLTGLDKAQGQREDREAADVVAAWHRQVGKLRSAVATANTALAAATATEHKYHAPLTIPDLQSATVPVTTAKQVPTAPRPCVVCGLRRDERLRGIDPDDLQDLFGEWWVEHWGHRACRNFWVEHEAALRSR